MSVVEVAAGSVMGAAVIENVSVPAESDKITSGVVVLEPAVSVTPIMAFPFNPFKFTSPKKLAFTLPED